MKPEFAYLSAIIYSALTLALLAAAAIWLGNGTALALAIVAAAMAYLAQTLDFYALLDPHRPMYKQFQNKLWFASVANAVGAIASLLFR